ncbi:hypothetical protein [Bosea sp. LjRoot237]|uniref:hypothetical protein n=1 Tax=Bosea sp. LjRoot237 TaxID=3342292 RepID=UPI003ECFF603
MSSMDRKTTFTLDELDLRRAVRLHAFSAFREKRTLTRMAVLWVIAMAAFIGFFSAAGSTGFAPVARKSYSRYL